MATVFLPSALEPWRHWLEWFDADVVSMLGPWLLRLDPMLGRNPLQTVRGPAEPDGVDDLRQRGRYERLLLSEWAMADAAPDEFLRRAANHEHLFLAPRMITRQADSVVTAIFDAGAGQWGAPRLLHVAAWILLARRARMARARFAWGRVDRPGELVEDDSPEALRRLLQARNHGVPDAQQYAAWFKHLARGSSGDERWLIAASPRVPAGFTHAFGVKQGFDAHLHVGVATPRARSQLKLPLPDAEAGSRVLRGEFIKVPHSATNAHQWAKGKGRLALQQPPLWNATGTCIAMPLKDGTTAATFEFRGSGEGRVASGVNARIRYSKWSAGQSMACGVLTGRAFSGVTLIGGYARMWQLPGLPNMVACDRNGLNITPGTSRWLPGFWLHDGRGNRHRLVMLDHAHRLHSWVQGEPVGTGLDSCKASDVLTLARVRDNVVIARHERGCVRIDLMGHKGMIGQLHWLPVEGTPKQVWLAGENHYGNRWVGMVAIEAVGADGQSRWSLYSIPRDGAHERTDLAERPGGQRKVIGLVRDQTDAGQTHMLACLSSDRRTLVGIGPKRIRNLYTAPADITAGSTTILGDKVALVTLSSQLVVLDQDGTRLALCIDHSGQSPSAEDHDRG